MTKAIIGIIIVAVLAVGGYFAFHKSGPSYSSTSNNSTSNAPSSNATNPTKPAAATITYTNSGFSPATITVKSGDTVAIKNDSSSEMALDSNPHPVHTDDTDLNVGTVAPGQTMTFTVIKKGTFGFHNHLNPSDQGTIVVQ